MKNPRTLRNKTFAWKSGQKCQQAFVGGWWTNAYAEQVTKLFLLKEVMQASETKDVVTCYSFWEQKTCRQDPIND